MRTHNQLLVGTLKLQILASQSHRLSPFGIDGFEGEPRIQLQAGGARAIHFG